VQLFHSTTSVPPPLGLRRHIPAPLLAHAELEVTFDLTAPRGASAAAATGGAVVSGCPDPGGALPQAAVQITGPPAQPPGTPADGAPPGWQRQGALLAYDFAACRLTALLGPVVELPGALLQRVQQGAAGNQTPHHHEARAPICSGLSGGSGGGLRDAGGSAVSSGVRALGGVLQGMAPGEKFSARIFLDWSVLEVFTASGQALATRTYLFPPRPAASPPATAASRGWGSDGGCGDGSSEGASVEVIALSGDYGRGSGAFVTAAATVHEMGSAWECED
jgi:hypothetical protein